MIITAATILFRIGTNLARDRFRLIRREGEMPKTEHLFQILRNASSSANWSNRLLSVSVTEDRQLLWLAYAEA